MENILRQLRSPEQEGPEVEKAEGKLKNYKLKHSRLLTCYSALLYLLAVYRRSETVHPMDAIAMIRLTPTERLEWLTSQPYLGAAHAPLKELLHQYEIFLRTTNVNKDELVQSFMDKATSQLHMGEAYTFGDLMFKALTTIGNGNRFHRLLVV